MAAQLTMLTPATSIYSALLGEVIPDLRPPESPIAPTFLEQHQEAVGFGGAVLLASSELPEVIGMSDRVMVMARGRLTGEMPAAEATQDAVMSLAVKEVESTRVR